MNRFGASLIVCCLVGCLDGAMTAEIPDVDVRPGAQAPGEPLTPDDPATPEAVAITTDYCDDDAFMAATWQTHTSPHFTINYLPGTPAETDRLVIAARLEMAYADIRAQLGITAEPSLTINLSPNRTAAKAHSVGLGGGWPNLGRYDVIYTGMADSYEVVRYGQLLTWMLDYHLDTTKRNRVALLTTGVAEYLDQSGRDLHQAYALQLDAGIESRVRIAEFDARDVSGRNPGRAGSLVQFLVDRFGIETFGDLYRASAVTWNGSCYFNATYGCVSTPEQLTAMLDGLLVAHTGEGWSAVQPMWQAEVEAALNCDRLVMGPTATAQIANVLRVMDKAVTTNDAAMYRSTLEGFYCDYGGEVLREQISARAVTAWGTTSSKLLAIFDTGIKNFSTAQALVQRTDDHGVTTFSTVYFEHVPVGWRVSYGPDWY
jgi:hypothetical protein